MTLLNSLRPTFYLAKGSAFVVAPYCPYRCFMKKLCVAGAAVIFEVQRSSRSDARKEEIRRQEIEAIRKRNEDLAREIEHLAQKVEELEKLARGQARTYWHS
ncbi:hypothetical protein RJT34_12457 [Clitoria ternatea]|uniref:Uncharacterized protein n=1 Tax=Clitoria ternatea TaxID=43366 RepID=A0AAN9JLR3_CLITE